MAAYLICLTAGSGIPVFNRCLGNLKSLPFPVIGSLNAVHMFAANHNAVLKSTTTEDARIVWREFRNSLVLILVTGRDSAPDDVHAGKLLENVFDAMTLLCGLEDLTNIKNIERFKKEIKVCFRLIDLLVDPSALNVVSDVTNAVDVLLPSEPDILLSFLEAFAEAADSPYGCLLVHGRVAVATKKWWELTPTELVLLPFLMISLPYCSARDIPVYLPHGSPTIPHRLLTFELLPHTEVCVICGPKPSLSELEREVSRFWLPALEVLKSTLQIFPRNFPTSTVIDSNILGFLLVNTSSNKCLSCVNPWREKEEDGRLKKRRRVLRSFYKQVVGTYFCSSVPATQAGPTEFLHQATDTYIVGSSYKCYAQKSGHYQIFIMFNTKIPTFAMRSVCQKTVNLFVSNKSFNI